MSAYQMASLHTKHSKQLSLPLGSRWGVPEGTSVADCLNWTWKPEPPPTPYHPEPQEPQLMFEEKEKRSVYVTPTTVEIEVPTPAIPAETPIKRVKAPTPKHMERNSTDVKCKTRIPRTEEWVVSSARQSARERPSEPLEFVRSTTPAPPTMRTARTGRVSNTGRISRQTPCMKKTQRRAPSPPPLTFDEYLQETGHPLASGRPQTPMKFSSYPQYKPSPHPDDVEYIVKQTRTMKMRTPTPVQRNGFNTALLAPRTEADDVKEKAMIHAIRKELHSSRDGGVVSTDPKLSITGEQYHQQRRATSAHPRSDSRALSRSQSQLLARPRSSCSNLEVVKEKKTVGFIDENEYYRYLTYLEDRYGHSPASSPAKHFGSWRGATKELVKKKPTATRGWVTPGSESPSKVNVAMDCPENADMTISLRVRNTPTATVY